MSILDIRAVPVTAPALEVPMMPTAVQAGFPSPALDFVHESINLQEHLVYDPPATFIARVSGDSMVGAGISHGDQLLIHKGTRPRDGDVVIAVLDGQFTVKRLRLTGARIRLEAANPEYPDIEIPELSELSIWGVAYMCLHGLR
ncbi:LexA family protein [Nesterenkonia haasae]|uniref:LexA family protein n=1 Tax=Nesterenkonia haasae TaxID=2587813 RepID=UPI0013916903|nr:S24 family peptidase [Nesterenkonia haasae]NDK30831.1 translesion error-prone DNA polymerase V autoproteolytic subunit [Nesterenkonia haasae]